MLQRGLRILLWLNPLLWLWFPLPASEPPAIIRFQDRAAGAGLRFVLNNSQSGDRRQIETMLGGVGVLDYDRDGWLDIYFVNGAEIPSLRKSGPQYDNRLYRNNGNRTFTDVTEKAGVRGSCYGMGVAAGDYDNDGFPDLYVAGVNCNQLFHNQGDGTFVDVTAKAGVAGVHPRLGKPFAVGAGWFDYNNDGHLDLFLLHYLDWKAETEPACYSYGKRAYCHPNSYKPLPNMLYRNNGDGTFTDVSDASGIGKALGKGMAVAFADYNGDGYTDIFVSNDTFGSFLFLNKGNGTFFETGVLAGVAYNEHGRAIAGMGVDFRDFDNDGRPDLFQAAMVGDTFPLYRNTGDGFADITAKSGLAALTGRLTAWSVGLFDFDNDGWKDIFTANASILDNAREIENLPDKLPLSVFRNAAGKFADVSASAGAGFLDPRVHRGAAFGDFDNDGRMDIVVNALNEPAKLLMNRTLGGGHWLLIELAGKKSNRDGLGASILVEAGGKRYYNHATTSVGYLSSSDRRVHFGLGPASLAERVQITWPGGRRQVLENVAADRILKVREP